MIAWCTVAEKDDKQLGEPPFIFAQQLPDGLKGWYVIPMRTGARFLASSIHKGPEAVVHANPVQHHIRLIPHLNDAHYHLGLVVQLATRKQWP
mmetsp:Transcript_22999/g.57742  ORF Transcript_22999/g.57742 Transcript_22999/m.57742 type:complete len:93 (-) Transcript_22999:718-996(-)